MKNFALVMIKDNYVDKLPSEEEIKDAFEGQKLDIFGLFRRLKPYVFNTRLSKNEDLDRYKDSDGTIFKYFKVEKETEEYFLVKVDKESFLKYANDKKALYNLKIEAMEKYFISPTEVVGKLSIKTATDNNMDEEERKNIQDFMVNYMIAEDKIPDFSIVNLDSSKTYDPGFEKFEDLIDLDREYVISKIVVEYAY